MIAKGLDNPNVTIVGVISADTSFNLPDYRSCERGFQLLTQVAGRAGRGDFAGKVYFQTSNPDFYALKTAQEQNYENFYEEEIESRLEFDYPPYSQILRLVISSKSSLLPLINEIIPSVSDVNSEIDNKLKFLFMTLSKSFWELHSIQLSKSKLHAGIILSSGHKSGLFSIVHKALSASSDNVCSISHA